MLIKNNYSEEIPSNEVTLNKLESYYEIEKGKEREDIINFVKRQFDPYRKNGIEFNQLEALQNLTEYEKKQIGFCRFQIINNKVYAENNPDLICPTASLNMFRVLVSSLQRILRAQPINNIDFVFFAVDNLVPSEGISNLIINSPTFMMSNDSSSNIEKERLLIPDAYLLSELTWPPLINEIIEGSKEFPWEKKDSSKIFWRGATTGGVYNLYNYDKLPRLTLVMLSKSFPDLIDARFMHYDQFSDNPSGRNLHIILNKFFDNPGRIREKDHLKYKYLISLDGNTASWLRVPWILLSNSVLLKQETTIMQMFYPALKPYIHYIPLEKNISDIFEKLKWLQNNDEQARIISKNATQFISSCLMPKDIDEYLTLTLKEYYSLQRFEISKPTLPLVEAIND